jgi:hypothetical protein
MTSDHDIFRKERSMRLKTVISALAVFLIAFNCQASSIESAGESKVNFGGKWMMDRSRSEGLPPEVDQIMTVTQNGDQLSVETKVYPENTPYYTVDDNYVINGKEVEFEINRPDGQKAKGKRTAKWSDDGKGLEIAEEVAFDSPQGPVKIETKRKWAMLDDGKTMIIELDQKGPRNVRTKRTFVKKS